MNVCTYVQSSYIICTVFTVNVFVLSISETMVALSENICTPTTNQTSFWIAAYWISFQVADFDETIIGRDENPSFWHWIQFDQ